MENEKRKWGTKKLQKKGTNNWTIKSKSKIKPKYNYMSKVDLLKKHKKHNLPTKVVEWKDHGGSFGDFLTYKFNQLKKFILNNISLIYITSFRSIMADRYHDNELCQIF